MITEIRYHNFRILADTVLKLSPCTLIVGPNGSGKSTAIRALSVLPNALDTSFVAVASVDVRPDPSAFVEISAKFDDGQISRARWVNDQHKQNKYANERPDDQFDGLFF
jgi:AAA15 family ATPase/GTPase